MGPRPGLTTDVLRKRTARLTAVELDPQLAYSLQERMKNTNAEVLEADAPERTRLPMGSRVLGAIGRMRLGSVSTKVLHAARGPILVHPTSRDEA